MIEKNRVKNNFSKNILTYDKNAIVQAYMADDLLNFIDGEKYGKILELGCGTGLYSLKLTEKYIDSNFEFVDISDEMIEMAKKKIKNENVKFTVGDAEKISISEEYNLVTGNAVIQWFNNLEDSLVKYYASLSLGGEMVFSTFGERTFCELKESYSEAGLEYNYSQKFYTAEEIKNIASKNGWVVEIYEKDYVLKYDSLVEFLYSIKRIGASSALKGCRVLTKGSLKAVEQIYRDKFSDGENILSTNHILYIKIKK